MRFSKVWRPVQTFLGLIKKYACFTSAPYNHLLYCKPKLVTGKTGPHICDRMSEYVTPCTYPQTYTHIFPSFWQSWKLHFQSSSVVSIVMAVLCLPVPRRGRKKIKTLSTAGRCTIRTAGFTSNFDTGRSNSLPCLDRCCCCFCIIEWNLWVIYSVLAVAFQRN